MEKIIKKIQDIKNKEIIMENFEKDLEELFVLFQEKVQENQKRLEKITKNAKLELSQIIDNIEEIRKLFFKFCCEFSKKEIFDIAFCYYRDLLIELAKLEEKVDKICTTVFDGNIKKYTLEILENKQEIKIITNDNVLEHQNIHNHNEKYYKIIEELEEKRKKELQKTIYDTP